MLEAGRTRPTAPPVATHDRGVVAATGVLATVVVVALVATALLAVGSPERLACGVGSAVTAVVGGPQEQCAEDTALAAQDVGLDSSSDDDGPDDREELADGGGLTARMLSATDSVRAPGPDPTAVLAPATLPADYTRCAHAPDVPGTAICLGGADVGPDGNAFTGSDRILRCATAVPTGSSEVCGETSGDARTSISTAAVDGLTRWCQPAEVTKTELHRSSFTIDWACASWAGTVFHCTSTTQRIGVATFDRVRGLTHEIDPAWTASPDYRELWPASCGSRTFGPTDLSCTPDPTTHLASCLLRAYQGLPRQPMTCVWFAAGPGEDSDRSNILERPMHCRLGTTGTIAAGTFDCAAGTGRRLLTARPLRDVVCDRGGRPDRPILVHVPLQPGQQLTDVPGLMVTPFVWDGPVPSEPADAIPELAQAWVPLVGALAALLTAFDFETIPLDPLPVFVLSTTATGFTPQAGGPGIANINLLEASDAETVEQVVVDAMMHQTALATHPGELAAAAEALLAFWVAGPRSAARGGVGGPLNIHGLAAALANGLEDADLQLNADGFVVANEVMWSALVGTQPGMAPPLTPEQFVENLLIAGDGLGGDLDDVIYQALNEAGWQPVVDAWLRCADDGSRPQMPPPTPDPNDGGVGPLPSLSGAGCAASAAIVGGGS